MDEIDGALERMQRALQGDPERFQPKPKVKVAASATVIGGPAHPGLQSIAIGYGAQALHADSICIGSNVVSTAEHQANFGQVALIAGCPNQLPSKTELTPGQFTCWFDHQRHELNFVVKDRQGVLWEQSFPMRPIP